MKSIRARVPRFAIAFVSMLACLAAPAPGGVPYPAVPAPAGQPGSSEMEQTLYVQAPDFAGGGESIVLVWLPEPLVSTCLGRTMKECFNFDFCIRTTNPNGPQCKNLAVPRARLPHYPPGMVQRRAMSVVLSKLGDSNGFDLLKSFYRSAPKASLQRLSSDATIRARISYNNSSSFEGFSLIQVLSAP